MVPWCMSCCNKCRLVYLHDKSAIGVLVPLPVSETDMRHFQLQGHLTHSLRGYLSVQKIQDDEQREIQEAGLDGKDAFAELKALAGKGGHMARGEGLPPPPQLQEDPQVIRTITFW